MIVMALFSPIPRAVIPEKSGIQFNQREAQTLDSRFLGNDCKEL